MLKKKPPTTAFTQPPEEIPLAQEELSQENAIQDVQVSFRLSYNTLMGRNQK